MSDTAMLVVVGLWLVVTGAGVVLTATMMYLTHSDLELYRSQPHQSAALLVLTRLAFWQEFRRFLIKLFLFTVGIESLFAPKVKEVCRTQSAYSWIFVAALFGAVLLMNYSTIQAMRFRHNFLAGRYANGNDRVAEGLEQLHQDNVATARELVRADDEDIRHVTEHDRDETKGGNP